MIEFINNNEFIETNTEPSKQYHRFTTSVINKCNTIIPRNKKFQTNILNPKPLQIRAFIKPHKNSEPTRPAVNFRNSPAYKLA
jgi:hypothetical protein